MSATERALRVIERSLAEAGPLTRAALRARLERAGVPGLEEGMIQLIFRASIDGLIVRGPMVGRQHAFALARDWLEPEPAPERERALAELARRYLAGHGPAHDRDLARWAGIALGDARAGLRAIASLLQELPGGLVQLRRGSWAPAAAPRPRLLGTFEPVLLGWRSRDGVLPGAEAAERIIRGGMFRAFALVGGRAAAVWTLTASDVSIEPFHPLDDADARALAADGQALRRFLDPRP